VLGASGLLGSELVKLLPDSTGATRTQLSVTDLGAMNGAMSHYVPEVVFNCAAYNAVDGAETEEDAAYQVNAQGAFNVALACAQNEVRLIHFSTNFVFSGTLDRPYLENDEVGPLGVYGKSKLEGEKLISMVMPRAVIIRTAALFGGDGSQQRRSFPSASSNARAQANDCEWFPTSPSIRLTRQTSPRRPSRWHRQIPKALSTSSTPGAARGTILRARRWMHSVSRARSNR
jgi:dTDP-4-dehydrorhamnose reductase